MKNSPTKANTGIDGGSKLEPREEKKTFQGLQGNDNLFILELVSAVEERARDETR
jgi:hypothetical protein